MAGSRIDLGEGFSYKFFQWDVNRRLNPQCRGVPAVAKAGVLIYGAPHDAASPDAEHEPLGACWFNIPEVMAIPGSDTLTTWELVSLDPLHIEPSVQMYWYDITRPEDQRLVPWHHGWIHYGRWSWA